MTKSSVYWDVRRQIIEAIASNQDDELKRIAIEHPEIFSQLTMQAKKDRKGSRKDKKRKVPHWLS